MYYFKQIEDDRIISVEAKSINEPSSGFVEVTKEEYDTFITSLPTPESEPPRCTYISLLEAVNPTKARPARIKRMWENREYFYDCFVSQTVKDEYEAGKIKVGDYIIVHFDDIGEQIVMAKVFKSW